MNFSKGDLGELVLARNFAQLARADGFRIQAAVARDVDAIGTNEVGGYVVVDVAVERLARTLG
ncbi:MAG: hypothetical protein ABI693_05440 [Bryobacteraceae bacterium]